MPGLHRTSTNQSSIFPNPRMLLPRNVETSFNMRRRSFSSVDPESLAFSLFGIGSAGNGPIALLNVSDTRLRPERGYTKDDCRAAEGLSVAACQK